MKANPVLQRLFTLHEGPTRQSRAETSTSTNESNAREVLQVFQMHPWTNVAVSNKATKDERVRVSSKMLSFVKKLHLKLR